MNLGETIYQLRTGKNMSQGDLADALGVSRQSISKWETNASVPELDKLIKLSEIFGVSLDELILNKPHQDVYQPAPSQTVYIEKAPPISARKIVGTILICFGALVWLLISMLGDVGAGLLMAFPFVLCGIICLLVRKNTGLWCAWEIYFMVDLYLRCATGVNWSVAFWSIRNGAWNIQAILAWCMIIYYAVMIVFTILRFRSTPMKCSRKNVATVIALWILYGLSFIPIYPDYTSLETIQRSQVILSTVDFTAGIVLVIALVFTARLLTSYKLRAKA